jgi:hypothetical protein
MVEPRPAHEPDGDVRRDLEPERAGHEGRLAELLLFVRNGVLPLTCPAAFIKQRQGDAALRGELRGRGGRRGGVCAAGRSPD